MPTYEYECAACGHRFELFQSMTSPPVKKCPKCGKAKVSRLIGSGGALIFKGSGFYVTDYRSEDYKKKAKSDTEPASTASSTPKADASSASATPAAESKPEPKAEKKPAAPAKPKKKSKD